MEGEKVDGRRGKGGGEELGSKGGGAGWIKQGGGKEGKVEENLWIFFVNTNNVLWKSL